MTLPPPHPPAAPLHHRAGGLAIAVVATIAAAGWICAPAPAAEDNAPVRAQLQVQALPLAVVPAEADEVEVDDTAEPPAAVMAREAAARAAKATAAVRGDDAGDDDAAAADKPAQQVAAAGFAVRANDGAVVQVEIMPAVEGVVLGGAVGGLQIAAEAREAAAADRDKPAVSIREKHPEAFEKLVSHRVDSLAEQLVREARESVVDLVKEHALGAETTADLVETANEAVAALKPALTEDFATFLDQLFGWSARHSAEEESEQLLEMLIAGIESGDIEDYLGFYHAPPELRLGRQQDWIDAVAVVLNDEAALAAWQQEFDDQLAAETEAVGEYLDEVRQHLRAEMETELQDQLDRLFKMVAFEEDAREDLQERAGDLVDQVFEDWGKEVSFILYRTEHDFWDGFAEEFGIGMGSVDWEQAVADTLTEEQLAAWDQVRLERDEEEMRRFEERIEATAANYENHFRNRMNESIDEVLLLMELEDERADHFRRAADNAVREVIEEWKNEARKWVDDLDGEARQQALRRGNVPIGFDGDKVARQPAWTGAFEEILTEEEYQRWNDIREAFDRERHAAAARIILVSMDQGVGLTADQWDQLAELFNKADLGRIVQRFTANHFHMHPNEFGRALRAMPEEKVREILTESQWQRWSQYIDHIENPHGTRHSVRSGRGDAELLADARRMEQAVTSFIHQRTAQERDRVLMEIMAEIEFISLTADLPELTKRRLQTAAKGAAEEVIDEWDDNFTRTIRERLRTVQAQNFERQLASLGHFSFTSRDVSETRVWNRLLAYLELDGQADTRTEALARREAIHQSAIADIVTIHSAGQLGMGPDQWPDLHAAVLASLAEYGPDFEAAMGRSNVAWYLRNPGIIMPLAGIPEDQLRGILTERQYRRWRDQVGTSTTGFWSRVESSHRQRTQNNQD